MAKRKSSKKSKGLSGWLDSFFSVASKPQVIGIVLILIAGFTLLSLITNSRGLITSAWIDGLEYLLGVGVWGFPFAFGALGLWTVLGSFGKENMSLNRPISLLLLLLVVSIIAALLIPYPQRMVTIGAADDGGLIGAILANFLHDIVGLWGAWAITTILAIVGFVLLLEQILENIAKDLWHWFTLWWTAPPKQKAAPTSYNEPLPENGYARAKAKIDPEVPLPSGQLPLWKKVREVANSPDSLLGALLVRFFGPRRSSAPREVYVEDPLPTPADLREPSPVSAEPAQGQSTRAERRTRKEQPQTQAAPAQAPQPATEPSASPYAEPNIIGATNQKQKFTIPTLDEVLKSWERVEDNHDHIRQQGMQIEETLALFGVPVSFEGVNQGPTVTQYLIRPGYDERVVKGETRRTKVKVSKIANLANDLALALAAPTVRIEAPVPGTSYVGIEIPNQASNIVGLRELMESENFDELEKKGKLAFALGEDVKGNAIVSDLAKMPHLLIAGATGAGKSVGINSIIISLLCTHTPDSLRLLMIDPKMVELSIYNRVPHLLSPVVTETDKAAGVLYWAVKEMERRYQLCSKANCRDLERYNAFLKKRGEKPLPYIVVIVDEMADLMMAAPEEVEKHICRLAQMARAIGIHMVIATQRPSVDVITGLIKANFPSRIAFAVSSQTDSRVILDAPGADRLLGKGDMLFMSPDGGKLMRLQGTWVSDDEINDVVDFWKKQNTPEPRRQPLAGPQMELFDDGMDSLETMPEADFGGATLGGANFDDAEAGLDLPPQQPPAAPTKAKPRPKKQSAASPQRPPATQPGTSKINLTPIQGSDGQVLGQQSYGAPPEQPSIFDEINAMRAVDARDELFDEAIQVVQEAGRGSVSLLQRKLRIGYNRAGRLVEQLEEAGYIGPDRGGSHGRQVLIGGPQQSNNANIDEFGNDDMAPLPPPNIVGSPTDDGGEELPPRVWM